jgi:DNA-binding NarL/FixJ family response regulator
VKRPRILLADDHALLLDGFCSLLEPQYEVVGTVENGQALVEAALRLNPDLVILDITMPLVSGIDAARRIRKDLPGVKLLFVTMHTSPAYLEAALEAGADGYAVKSSERSEILAAVESVLAGSSYVAPSLSRPSSASPTLSGRERQILQLTAEGKSRKEIAYDLGISEKTVAFHKDNLKRKLGLQTTAHLTRYALDQELI